MQRGSRAIFNCDRANTPNEHCEVAIPQGSTNEGTYIGLLNLGRDTNLYRVHQVALSDGVLYVLASADLVVVQLCPSPSEAEQLIDAKCTPRLLRGRDRWVLVCVRWSEGRIKDIRANSAVAWSLDRTDNPTILDLGMRPAAKSTRSKTDVDGALQQKREGDLRQNYGELFHDSSARSHLDLQFRQHLARLERHVASFVDDADGSVLDMAMSLRALLAGGRPPYGLLFRYAALAGRPPTVFSYEPSPDQADTLPGSWLDGAVHLALSFASAERHDPAQVEIDFQKVLQAQALITVEKSFSYYDLIKALADKYAVHADPAPVAAVENDLVAEGSAGFHLGAIGSQILHLAKLTLAVSVRLRASISPAVDT